MGRRSLVSSLSGRERSCECGRTFQNAQALRAHGRFCAAVVPGSRAVVVPGHSRGLHAGARSKGFDPADHVRQQVETEEQRLRLREIQSVHDELDTKERSRVKDSQREGEVARGRVEDERERKRRESREAVDRRRRRDIIQRVKTRVLSWEGELRWSLSGIKMIPELKAEIVVEIERTLSSLPVDELVEDELVTIAEGVVDRFYQVALKAKEGRDAQGATARRERLRVSEEVEAQERRKFQLVSRAESYAGAQLGEFSFLDRMKIVGQVRKAVVEEIDGSESEVDVEGLADEVLDDLLPDEEDGAG